MTELSRRTVLGAAGAFGAGTGLLATPAPAGAAPAPPPPPASPSPDLDAGPARAALERLVPGHADRIRLVALAGGGPDRFRVTGSAGRLEIAATGPATALTGLHWYLKETRTAHLTWAAGRTELPGTLPAPARPVERTATVPHRFALNDTHDGYTGPYADWPRWERLIDVLALHGCNEVLVTVGQEAVYERVLREFGYSDAEARGWLPAPSHQPWWLLQNMSGYGGPLSPALIARRAELGARITARLRELGMRPVLPGWFGTVPDGFADRNRGARVIPQGEWNGLRRPDWLDPRSALFPEVAAAFYRHQGQLLGDARHFKMDLLHEGGTAGDVPVADAARAVEKALRTARPGAVWVMLGWRANPPLEVLAAVDTSRVLVVDGLSDLASVTDRERDWGGAPYAFGSIPNFGGRTTLGACTHRWSEKFVRWRDRPGSTLAGTAYMPESAERDPAAFELFSELAWRAEPVDREGWFRSYADLRLGGADGHAREAYAALAATAYRLGTADGRPVDSLFTRRPSLTAWSGTAFDPARFDRALVELLAVAPGLRGSDAYAYDLTDVARQALANRSRTLLPQLRRAHEDRDPSAFRALSRLWLRLMRLADRMSGCHRAFLLGPWLADAHRFATDPAEAARLERTARALITTWAGRPAAVHLSNYADRDWQGLLMDVHLPQWRAYLDDRADALAHGAEPRAFDWYEGEEAWTRRRGRYPVAPTGDPYRTARRVHDVLAAAPYQGALTVTADPPRLAPGATGTLTATLRNLNGLRATGRVGFALSGPDAAPPGTAWLPRIPAGGEGAARWRITAPAGPPRAVPYEVRAAYGPDGEDPVTVVRRGEVRAAPGGGAGT
ncbi:alpha-N-acetylglucosaminidase TIM-barrel domain-containing protein [Streptomyces sp. NPDC059070]|uniref:alpha-N-acetylglucosaminidase n=1 Tax=Streptomyces sp. NPDC059070 TaxID=3346713 RepID=UPI0036950850